MHQGCRHAVHTDRQCASRRADAPPFICACRLALRESSMLVRCSGTGASIMDTAGLERGILRMAGHMDPWRRRGEKESPTIPGFSTHAPDTHA